MMWCNMKRISLLATIMISAAFFVHAQVQVSQEPHHKNVLENSYLRILDVRIPQKDTTLFHIHSTPAVTFMYTTTAIGTQNMGRNWSAGRNVAGRASYGSAKGDPLIHRVTNADSVPFHVNVIEILSAYGKSRQEGNLPFPVLFDNDKTVGYRLTDSLINRKTISGRGPIVLGLMEGNKLIVHDVQSKKETTLHAGDHLYIKPESSFYFLPGKEGVNLVMFEVK